MSFTFPNKTVRFVQLFFGRIRTKIVASLYPANTMRLAMPCPGGFVPSVADSGRISFGAAARPARR
jgi:hypothetical protein